MNFPDHTPTLGEARALQALVKGEADPDQQRRALTWIIHKACGVSFDTFSPGHPDVTLVNQGRRQAGLLISEVLMTEAEKYRKQGEIDQ